MCGITLGRVMEGRYLLFQEPVPHSKMADNPATTFLNMSQLQKCGYLSHLIKAGKSASKRLEIKEQRENEKKK